MPGAKSTRLTLQCISSEDFSINNSGMRLRCENTMFTNEAFCKLSIPERLERILQMRRLWAGVLRVSSCAHSNSISGALDPSVRRTSF